MSQSATPIGSRQVAEILGWSIAKVKREALDGALQPYATKLPGQTGAYVFDRDAIDRIAAETPA